MLYRTHIFPKNLIFLTYQILSFKYGKISFRIKFSDKSLSKIPLEIWTEFQRDTCSKEKYRVTILFAKKKKKAEN